MHFSNLVLAGAAVVAAAAATNTTAGDDGKPRKMILDNDWASVAFLPILQALDAGWDVVGVVGDTADSWSLQTSLHALAGLELGNLSSCIPVHKGADYPLLNTPELFQLWSTLHGKLPWVRLESPSRSFPLNLRDGIKKEKRIIILRN